MKEQNNVSRRAFIQRLTIFGAAGTAISSVLVGCGGGEGSGTETATAEVCYDPEALPEAQQQLYESLQYVEQSTTEGQYCDNCLQWQPAQAGETCGGCQVLPGPVHPQGWCSAWVAQQGVPAS